MRISRNQAATVKLTLPENLCSPHNSISVLHAVKFRFFEKATKIGEKSPTCFDVTEETSKIVGDFFQTLCPSHNILTLLEPAFE